MQEPLKPLYTSRANGTDKAGVHDGVWAPSLWLIGAVVATAASGCKSQWITLWVSSVLVHIINALHRLKWREVITCLLCGFSGGCIKEECRVSLIYDLSETPSRLCLSVGTLLLFGNLILCSCWSDLWILCSFSFIFNISAWLWCYVEKDAFGFTPGLQIHLLRRYLQQTVHVKIYISAINHDVLWY